MAALSPAARRAVVLACVLGLGLPQPLVAQRLVDGPLFPQQLEVPDRPPVDPRGEFLLRADEVAYDRTLEIVTATGNVEISQGERVLLADQISYNRAADVVTASGNVALIEPTGEVIFGSHLELTRDLANAVIRDLRVRMAENSRIAANSARRENGERKVMREIAFTPCSACEVDPLRSPTWQIKAAEAVHDEVSRDMIYSDVTLELFGVPVFYSPYLRHPDPSVKRRSGFLMPSFGQGNNTGFFTGVPYFWAYDQSTDATIEPRYFTEEGPQVLAEVRRRFSDGQIRIAGSALNGRRVDGGRILADRTWRGHIAAEGRFSLSDDWRAGFDLARTTDRTYLRRFKIDNDWRARPLNSVSDFLVSTAYVEGFQGRSYYAVENFAFQSLREFDTAETIPKVHPLATASWVSSTDNRGGYFRSDTSMLALTRQRGNDTNRISTVSGYYLPFTSQRGDVWSIAATVQADAYYVNQVSEGLSTPYSGFTGRVHPQLSVQWRYPLVRRLESASILIEPRVGLVVGPNGNNPNRIPNEDSRGFEFDETNLFGARRYQGVDRIASGQRVDYGVNASIFGASGGSISAFVGQSIRSRADSTYAVGSGLEDRVSDVVGRVTVQPLQYLAINYRFRLDQDSFKSARDELGLTLYHGRSAVSLSYIQRDRVLARGTSQPFESASIQGSVQLTEEWSAYGLYVRDIAASQSVRAAAGLMWRDDCFASLLTVERDFSNDRDLSGGTTIMLRVGFRYLGDIGG
ncbi:MAG: LPS assembly protein LptD [Alphaproteobacteria bacterium]|nr:LPS assembly protein LptD [Alphaproteobacteria bacterium]